MDVQRVTHEVWLQQWSGIVKECRGSEKSIQRWCVEQGINNIPMKIHLDNRSTVLYSYHRDLFKDVLKVL